MSCIVDGLESVMPYSTSSEYTVGIDVAKESIKDSLAEFIIKKPQLKSGDLIEFTIKLETRIKDDIKTAYDLGFNSYIRGAISYIREYTNGRRCIYCCRTDKMNNGICDLCGVQFRY